MQWGMKQDWELEDLVPKYTIESSKGSNYAMFWTQLRQSSSPALSSCSEEDLESRYRSLLDDALTKRKNKHYNHVDHRHQHYLIVICLGGEIPIKRNRYTYQGNRPVDQRYISKSKV